MPPQQVRQQGQDRDTDHVPVPCTSVTDFAASLASSAAMATRQLPNFKYPQYAHISERIRSFWSFPSDKEQTHEQLSQAGFFYAGMDDCTRCFHCGGGLRNWLPGDVPSVEHARWFPECGHIRERMGADFVDNVNIIHPRQDEFIEDADENVVVPEPVDYTEMVESVLRKPCGAALAVLDITRELMRSAVTKVLSDAGWDETKVTSEKLARAALEMNDDHESAQSNNAHAHNNAVIECRDEVDSVQPEPQPAVTNLSKDVASLKIWEENKQLRDQMKCKVCLDIEVSIAFLPCGHLVTCSQCYSSLKNCVICRAKIVASVKTFIS